MIQSIDETIDEFSGLLEKGHFSNESDPANNIIFYDAFLNAIELYKDDKASLNSFLFRFPIFSGIYDKEHLFLKSIEKKLKNFKEKLDDKEKMAFGNITSFFREYYEDTLNTKTSISVCNQYNTVARLAFALGYNKMRHGWFSMTEEKPIPEELSIAFALKIKAIDELSRKKIDEQTNALRRNLAAIFEQFGEDHNLMGELYLRSEEHHDINAARDCFSRASQLREAASIRYKKLALTCLEDYASFIRDADINMRKAAEMAASSGNYDNFTRLVAKIEVNFLAHAEPHIKANYYKNISEYIYRRRNTQELSPAFLKWEIETEEKTGELFIKNPSKSQYEFYEMYNAGLCFMRAGRLEEELLVKGVAPLQDRDAKAAGFYERALEIFYNLKYLAIQKSYKDELDLERSILQINIQKGIIKAKTGI